METKKQTYKTLEDLAKILALFNTLQVEERGVNEISKTIGMLPSKVSRMIRTLESKGFFEKNLQTGKYRLGVQFLELGMAFVSNFPLRKIFRPHLEQIFREVKLTTSWGILRNEKVIIVDRVQNANIDLLTYRVGLNLPIHSTSLGKILLAHLPEKEQNKILYFGNLVKFTDATIIDPKLVKKNLRLIRERGYSTDAGETHDDLNSIAAPIKKDGGDVIAALNLMDERSRTSEEKLFQYADYLKEKALFISRQLGYRNNTL